MWPDNLYAPSRGSFVRPVPVPTTEPGDAPTIAVSINCYWLAYIRGALQQLLLQATWSTDDPAVHLLAQQRAATLIAMFEECTGILPFSCAYDFTLSQYAWVFTDPGPDWTPRQFGIYVPSVGFSATSPASASFPTYGFTVLAVELTFAPRTITEVQFVYDLAKGTFNTPSTPSTGIILYSAGSNVGQFLVDSTTDPDGTNKVLSYLTAGITCDRISIFGWSQYANPATSPGSLVIKAVGVDGVGIPLC